MAKESRKKGLVARNNADSEKDRILYERERQKREFNEYQRESNGSVEKTVHQTTNSIAKLESFLGNSPFTCIDRKSAKAFKEGLATEVNPRTGRLYAASYVTKILQDNRRFLQWIRDDLDKPGREFKKAIEFFAPSSDTQKASRTRGPKETPQLEEVRAAILAMPSSTIVQRRDRAMIALLLLAGMRDGAQSGMLIGAIDLAQGVVRQRPPWVGQSSPKNSIRGSFLWVTTSWKSSLHGLLSLPKTNAIRATTPCFRKPH